MFVGVYHKHMRKEKQARDLTEEEEEDVQNNFGN